MKVFLDDVRDCPEGWTLARNYNEAIQLLRTREVKVISLDHDLGMEVTGKVDVDDWDEAILLARDIEAKTGYDVACWIEQAVFEGRICAPFILCHSANPVGKKRIMQVAVKINEINSRGVGGGVYRG